MPSCSGAWCSSIKEEAVQGSPHRWPTLLMPLTLTLLLGLRIFLRLPESEMPLMLRRQPSGAQAPGPVGDKEGSGEEMPSRALLPC